LKEEEENIARENRNVESLKFIDKIGKA